MSLEKLQCVSERWQVTLVSIEAFIESLRSFNEQQSFALLWLLTRKKIEAMKLKKFVYWKQLDHNVSTTFLRKNSEVKYVLKCGGKRILKVIFWIKNVGDWVFNTQSLTKRFFEASLFILSQAHVEYYKVLFMAMVSFEKWI